MDNVPAKARCASPSPSTGVSRPTGARWRADAKMATEAASSQPTALPSAGAVAKMSHLPPRYPSARFVVAAPTRVGAGASPVPPTDGHPPSRPGGQIHLTARPRPTDTRYALLAWDENWGHSLADERVERRLAAVLAADVAGYSRLMGVDEEGTLARLKAARKSIVDPAIASHRGRIVKTTGDGLLVEFASAVDAVRSSVETQQGMAEHNAGLPQHQRIEFRIGVHIGDIIIDDNDIFGDGVNIAARLEGIAVPGGICISDDTQRQVRGKVDTDFEDLGPQTLKNIAEPMRVWRSQPSFLRIAAAAQPVSPANKTPALALPDRPSIAVLPFQNMSGDPEQDYFADGIVEDIITALSRFKSLFVIARNSSFTYKGRAVDIKQVGRELGVRYVLEGSVRKSGGRVRITGQLIDAATGAHLWADRFDGELKDIFDLQDSVTSSVVGAIAPRLELAEIERAKYKPTESLDAYDYCLRGIAIDVTKSSTANERALQLFYKAIEIDSDFALPYARAVICYIWRKPLGWITDEQVEAAEVKRLLQKMVALGKDDAYVLCVAANALIVIFYDAAGGAEQTERARGLNRNLAYVWAITGLVNICVGQHDIAIENLSYAMRLSPMDTLRILWIFHTSLAHYFAGRYSDAFIWSQKALQEQSEFPGALRTAAASQAMAGNLTEARKWMAQLCRVDPKLRMSNVRRVFPPFREEDATKYAEGLRLAGLPE